MGVYSTAAAEHLRESQLVKDFHYTDLLEYAVNTEITNQKMFNAMIELDFHEAVEKMKGSYLTEAEEAAQEEKKVSVIKKIVDRIVAALEKFAEMITTAINKFVINCQEFFGFNKRLVKKIGELDSATLEQAAIAVKGKYDSLEFKKFIGRKNGDGENADVFINPCEELTKIKAQFNQKYTGITDGWIKDKDVNTLIKEKIEEIRKVTSGVNAGVADDKNAGGMFEMQPLRKYINDNNYVKNLSKNLEGGFKKIVDEFCKTVNDAKDENKTSITNTKNRLKTAKKDKDAHADVIASLTAELSIYNALNAQYAKLLREGMALAVAKMKSDRAAYAKLGMIVAKSKVKTESALLAECASIDMINEEFVDSIFA